MNSGIYLDVPGHRPARLRHHAFHEDCTVAIGKRVVKLLDPKWLRIGGYFYPRGGMPIDVFWQYFNANIRVPVTLIASVPLSGDKTQKVTALWSSTNATLRIASPSTASLSAVF